MAANLQSLLDQLENTEIIRRLASDDLQYAFKHTLTQEAAYQSLLKPRRREMHQAVAQAYEELYPERLDEFAALLAEHYAQAGDEAKTLEYAVRAGDAAARLYAHTEAIAHYSQALEIVKRLTPALRPAEQPATHDKLLRDLYLKRGRAFEVGGQYNQALDNYEEMKALARARGDERMELEALMACTTLHSIPGPANDPLLARGLATQALVLAQELGLRDAEAKIYWNLMLLENWGGGDPRRAIEFGEKSLALAREFDLREQLAFTLHDLGMSYLLAKEIARAETAQREAEQLWRESHNVPMYVESLNRTLLMHVNAGNMKAAVACGLQARQLAQSIGNVVGKALAAVGLCHIHAALGQFDQSFEYGAEGIQYSLESGVPSMRLSIQNQFAWIYGSLGMVDKGIEIARDGLGQATQAVYGGDSYRLELSHSSFEATLIRLELLKGEVAKAQEIFRETPPVVKEEYPVFISVFDGNPIYLCAGELHLAEGDYAATDLVLERFLSSLESTPIRPFFPGASFLKGKLLLAQGHEEKAVEAWQTARAEAEAMNLRPILWQILVALAESFHRQGHHAEANDLLEEARVTVEYIAQHSPADLRSSFLALPKVTKVMDGAGASVKAGITYGLE